MEWQAVKRVEGGGGALKKKWVFCFRCCTDVRRGVDGLSDTRGARGTGEKGVEGLARVRGNCERWGGT